MKPTALLLVLVALGAGTPLALRAQTPPPSPEPIAQPASQSELDSWVGPIALYPDPLLAQVLNAATTPSDVVQADRYLANGGDPSQVDAQPWNPSVKALTRYPGVLQMMEDYLPWTTALGQAYLSREAEVMNTIQRLRALAWELGNLESTPEENVFDDDGTIEILPSSPDVIYIPYYEPSVVFAQRVGPPCISFSPPCPLGFWLDRDFDWRHHDCLVWDHSNKRPADWWSNRHHSAPVAASPGQHTQLSNVADNPRTRPVHFVLWQAPQVRVVGGGDPAVRGAQRGEPQRHHIEPAAAPRSSGSSMIVLPNRGVMAAAHGAKGSSSIQVFSSGKPVHLEEVSGGHRPSSIAGESESAHVAQTLSAPGRSSHQVTAGSHGAAAHVTSTPRTSGGSRTASAAHVQTSSHSSSGSSRR